jgi:hypothetical protein
MFSMGQSSLGKTDDLGRIAIAAVVPDEAGIPAGAQRMLQSRLTQVATLNGLGAAEGSQFAMLPMVSIISKDVTPTAPPMISLNMEITLYIVDAKSQAIFSQTSIPLKGVGNTEDRAYTQAINNINPRHGQFRGFVEKGKEKIVEYYNSQCDVIISSAKALAGQKKYDEALATLFNVPDVSRECYDKCMNISVDIYQEYSNQQCNVYLSAAKAAWAGKELSKVEENLGKITPDMSCYDEAQQLVATVSTAVEAEGGSAWNFKMKKYDDSVDIQKMKIQAGKEVAQSWAYHGAAAHFDWSWMYPGSEKKVVEQPKTEPQSEPQKVTEQATTTPSSEKKPPIGERPKASDLVVPIFKDGKPTFNDKIGFEEYPIITSNTSIKTIAGVIQRQFCIAPEGFSPLEIVRFYQSFIESKGGKMIYQAREANTFKIDGKHPSAYLNTHAISRTSNYEYMRASCNEYFVGVIYTDKTDLYLVVGAGRADGKPVYHLVTVEVAQ